MFKSYALAIFLMILTIAITGLSITGNQIVELPSYQSQTILDCPVKIEVGDYSPKNLLLKNPLITGYAVSEQCRDAGKYHVKANDKILPKYSCENGEIITYRSCSTGEVFLHGVLTKLNLTEKQFKNGVYQGSWRCPKGQQCVVEKRGTELFKGCESKLTERPPAEEKPIILRPLEYSCSLEITYVDFKTEILIDTLPNRKIIVYLIDQDIETPIDLEEKTPGIYSKTLVFRKEKSYQIKYGTYLLPLEVVQAPKDLQNKKIKKLHQSALENVKKLLLKLV